MSSDRIDPASYLLRELSAEETEEAERLLESDDSFRDTVDRLRPVCEKLEGLPGAAWDEGEPPPLRLSPEDLASEPEQPELVPRDEQITPRRTRRRLGRLIPPRRPAILTVAACGLLAAGVGLGLLIGGDGDADSRDPGDSETFALNPIVSLDPPPGGEALVSGDSDERTLEVTVDDLPPSSGDLYELWLLDGSRGLLSLGSFSVPESGTAAFEAPMPVDPAGFTYFDVSREPSDGDPAHSGESLLRGPTS